MLGVDRLDQRISYYQFIRKSVRWWRKVFFWIVEVMVVNAYILYSTHTDAPRKLSHKEFRRKLVLKTSATPLPIANDDNMTKPWSSCGGITFLIGAQFNRIAMSVVCEVKEVNAI